MRLMIIGCEYTGKTALAEGIKKWAKDALGAEINFHDHFLVPNPDPGHPKTGADTEKEQKELLHVMHAVPTLLEKYQRYITMYHISNLEFYRGNDHYLVGTYYSEAVYAPLYYGYGQRGKYSDRRVLARLYDKVVLDHAPDMVLVLMTALPEVITKRMKESPHIRCVLKEKDIELVLRRFNEEYEWSLILRRFKLDTTNASIRETFQKFLKFIEPHLTAIDRFRILTHQTLKKDIH